MWARRWRGGRLQSRLKIDFVVQKNNEFYRLVHYSRATAIRYFRGEKTGTIDSSGRLGDSRKGVNARDPGMSPGRERDLTVRPRAPGSGAPRTPARTPGRSPDTIPSSSPGRRVLRGGSRRAPRTGALFGRWGGEASPRTSGRRPGAAIARNVCLRIIWGRGGSWGSHRAFDRGVPPSSQIVTG